MRRIFACLIIASIVLGCGTLKIQKDDSIPAKMSKGFARVPLGIMTFGLSEAYYFDERRKIAIEESMKSWVGLNANDLIMSWGPPSEVVDDGKGGKYIVYRATRNYVMSPGYARTTTSFNANGVATGNNILLNGSGVSSTTYYPPKVLQLNVYRMFCVNGNGKIVSYTWKGL